MRVKYLVASVGAFWLAGILPSDSPWLLLLALVLILVGLSLLVPAFPSLEHRIHAQAMERDLERQQERERRELLDQAWHEMHDEGGHRVSRAEDRPHRWRDWASR